MSELQNPIQAEQHTLTLAERRAAGRKLRNKVPRSSHAEWVPAPNRPNPLSLLQEQNRSRLQHLVPLRFARMSASPFTFLRGSAIVMAQDLAVTPVSGIQVQICGDAHLNNFGIYATPERNQVFDVNDFDETLPGPWEWDLKRFSAAIVVAGRQNRVLAKEIRRATRWAVRTYRTAMARFAAMPYLDVWYTHLDRATDAARLTPMARE